LGKEDKVESRRSKPVGVGGRKEREECKSTPSRKKSTKNKRRTQHTKVGENTDPSEGV